MTLWHKVDYRQPEDKMQELAAKYNVCFYIIGDAATSRAQKRLREMAKANECSRVIPFAAFINNPEYLTGALFVVKATEEVLTITETRVVGLQVDDILFDYDQATIRPEFNGYLNDIETFLQQNPNAFVKLEGYTDSIGSDGYNLQLSRRRATGVADFLMINFGIAREKVVVHWYGKTNPVAGNDTAEGRRLNRRVEIAVGRL